jgi:hypothetical protein
MDYNQQLIISYKATLEKHLKESENFNLDQIKLTLKFFDYLLDKYDKDLILKFYSLNVVIFFNCYLKWGKLPYTAQSSAIIHKPAKYKIS